jgi:hypothetical protein
MRGRSKEEEFRSQEFRRKRPVSGMNSEHVVYELVGKQRNSAKRHPEPLRTHDLSARPVIRNVHSATPELLQLLNSEFFPTLALCKQ